MHAKDIPQIQQYLKDHQLDGWLLADFHGRNDIFVNLLGITGMLTRRGCYFIPREGEPVAIINPIDAAKFDDAPGRKVRYRGYKGLEDEIRKAVSGCQRLAMEYSSWGRLPYIGVVDAGTIELIRSMAVEIVTSADLVAHFQARLTAEQMDSHRQAAREVTAIKDAAFAHIADAVKNGHTVTEYDVIQFILQRFEERGMETDHGPNCSVDAHAGDPHYEPKATGSTPIGKGQLVLIDLWAKFRKSGAVYADITWMAYTGTRDEIPARYVELFDIIRNGRDAAVAFLNEHLDKRTVQGWEVDDACRAVIDASGHGEQFVHRTGHSIGTEVHGAGPNLDNLETEDNRALQIGHLFSIEPGLYFDDCGLRTEIDAFVTESGLEIATQPPQIEILAMLDK